MGHRLSKIYTRTGDNGETGLGDGARIAKDHPRVEAIGHVDELNSVIGMILSNSLPDHALILLVHIQHKLFDLGGELSIPGHQILKDDEINYLETHLDTLNTELPMLKEFILPGGSQVASLCHFARTVCRRAERSVVTLAREDDTINPTGIRYLNRLSDLLFVLARDLNRIEKQPDVLWQQS